VTQPAPDDPSPAGPSPVGPSPDAAGLGPSAQPRPVTMRRAPKYRAFVVTGVLVGLVLSLVLIQAFPEDHGYSTSTVLSYLAAVLGLAGGVLGAGLALLVERPRR